MTFNVGNPVTPSQRNLIKLKKNHLSRSPFLKSEISGLKNNDGRVTSYHRGGGHKQKYRKINFFRTTNCFGVIVTIEYDPNRTANIASLYDFLNNDYSYILAPKNLNIGDIVKSGINAEINLGHSLPIAKIPVGSLIHNISPKKNKEAQISRAAGSFSQLMEKTSERAKIKISSGEERFISLECYATLGIVSNEFYFLTNLGKAGRSRWLNKRPTVRGVAMNPIDHPNGGGEGKKSGSFLLTPWGKSKKSKYSRSKNKFIVVKKKK